MVCSQTFFRSRRFRRFNTTAQATTVGDVGSPSRVQGPTAAAAGSDNKPTSDFSAMPIFDHGAHGATACRNDVAVGGEGADVEAVVSDLVLASERF